MTAPGDAARCPAGTGSFSRIPKTRPRARKRCNRRPRPHWAPIDKVMRRQEHSGEAMFGRFGSMPGWGNTTSILIVAPDKSLPSGLTRGPLRAAARWPEPAPAKLAPAKLAPAKLVPAKLAPANLVPAKLVPANAGGGGPALTAAARSVRPRRRSGAVSRTKKPGSLSQVRRSDLRSAIRPVGRAPFARRALWHSVAPEVCAPTQCEPPSRVSPQHAEFRRTP